jgi:hypothetical protein
MAVTSQAADTHRQGDLQTMATPAWALRCWQQSYAQSSGTAFPEALPSLPLCCINAPGGCFEQSCYGGRAAKL